MNKKEKSETASRPEKTCRTQYQNIHWGKINMNYKACGFRFSWFILASLKLHRTWFMQAAAFAEVSVNIHRALGKNVWEHCWLCLQRVGSVLQVMQLFTFSLTLSSVDKQQGLSWTSAQLLLWRHVARGTACLGQALCDRSSGIHLK